MKKQLACLLSFVLSLSFSAYASDFNRIVVSGNVDLYIKGKAGQPSLVLSHSGLSHVSVAHGTLYVSGVGPRPTVWVRVAALTAIAAHGDVRVAGNNVQSPGLTVVADGMSSVKLLGVLPVVRIMQTGDSQVYVRWVNGTTLSVFDRGQAHTYLGGVANTMYARVFGQSVLNAEYLRTGYVQVQTTGQGRAYVYPVTTLRAFASDAGNVYYYKYPENITRDTAASGNVLQMAWRP